MEDGRPRPQEQEFSGDLPDVQESFTALPVPETEIGPHVVSEEDLAGEAMKKSSEAARAHAEASAQRNDPLERVRERRQEIKDQVSPQTAVPVGSILAQTPQPPHPVGMPTQAPEPLPVGPTDTYNEPIQLPQPVSLYRQAIIGGFLAAVVVLLILAIVLIIG